MKTDKEENETNEYSLLDIHEVSGKFNLSEHFIRTLLKANKITHIRKGANSEYLTTINWVKKYINSITNQNIEIKAKLNNNFSEIMI